MTTQGGTTAQQGNDLEAKVIPMFHSIKTFRSNYFDDSSPIPKEFLNSCQLISDFTNDYNSIILSIQDLLKDIDTLKTQFHQKHSSNNGVQYPIYSCKQSSVIPKSVISQSKNDMNISKYFTIDEGKLMRDVNQRFKSAKDANEKVCLLQNLVSSMNLE